MAGSSHTTLRETLGIKPGMRLFFSNVPADITTQLGDVDDDTTLVNDPVLANFFLYFISTRSELSSVAETLQHLYAPSQIVWIACSQKSSKNLTEQDLRDALLPIGMVDTKLAPISVNYYGLKFAWRKHRLMPPL